jgi:cell division protein FtsW
VAAVAGATNAARRDRAEHAPARGGQASRRLSSAPEGARSGASSKGSSAAAGRKRPPPARHARGRASTSTAKGRARAATVKKREVRNPSPARAAGRTGARTGAKTAEVQPQRTADRRARQNRRLTARRRGTAVKVGVARSAVARTEPAYFVLVPTAALLLLGLVMVFSAGSIIGMGQSIGGYRYFLMQLGWAAFGLALMVFFWKFDYHKLGKVSWVGVVISIALLGMVLYSGRSAFGARRWISVGPLGLQPTEIAKFTLVVFAAYVLSMKGDKLKQAFHLFVPVILVAMIEAALILKQPDLGSTLVLCFSVLLMLVIARTKGSHLALVGGVGAAGALFFALSAPYRRARLFSFINPWKSARGAGYHVIQSYIALGTGHIKGLGLGMSRQKFLYLPNAHTDFIFAIIGEELGLLGTMVVLVLVALLAYGGLRIASSAPDELGKLLAAGITGLIVIQALVNMGGVTGLLPITGVPLPLVSSGGSSLCVCMACIGILLNIAAQTRR